MTVTFSRQLPVRGAFNLRDLGGYATRQGGETLRDRAWRSDGLSRLSHEDMDLMLARGLRRVIDLRAPDEVAAHPGKFSGVDGVEVINLPVFDSLAPDSLAQSDDPLPHFYRQMLTARGSALREVFHALADAPGGPVLFHCTAGKDRTGLVAALWLALAGVSREDVIADYALTAELIPGLIARFHDNLRARGIDPALVAPMFACKPAYMADLLDFIDQTWGGAADCLRAQGVSTAELSALTARLNPSG